MPKRTPEEQTEYDRARHHAYYLKNREKILAYSKAWKKSRGEAYLKSEREAQAERRRKNPEREKAMRAQLALKRKERNRELVGMKFLPGQTVDGIIAIQEGRCAICGRRFRNTKETHIDHCHKTGYVRGALCSRHNLGVGYFQDSPELLRKAADYLDAHAARIQADKSGEVLE